MKVVLTIFKTTLRVASLFVAVVLSTQVNAANIVSTVNLSEVQIEISEYVERISKEHGLLVEDLNDVLGRAERKQSIIDAISRPAERTLKWHEYKKIFHGERRIKDGVTFWKNNANTLSIVEKKYGIPAEYIVAIIGVETSYGQNMGSYRVVDALSTLAFHYPPRSKFFRRELTQFLLLSREENIDPFSLIGSYAGAMGYGQFMPSSYRAYAIDSDLDGRRDIWENTEDAIASVANYLSEHGWIAGQEVATKAFLSDPAISKIANIGLKPAHTISNFQEMGIKSSGFSTFDKPSVEKVSLFRMELVGGPQYWVGFNNFYAITRYNHSRLYALAVHELSQMISNRFYVDVPED